jgi:hypothetical protein
MSRRAQLTRIILLSAGAIALMALVTVGFANADGNQAGTTAANFLSVGAGPRILGMGGATIGLGQDLAGGAWNPAALGWMDQTSVMVSHAGLENQSLQEWAGIGGRFGKSGTRWSVSGLYQGDGSFEGRDASNNSTGSFSVSSFAIGGHLAQQLGSVLTLGLGFKTVSEKLGDVSGVGGTFDAGVMLHRGLLGAGFAAENVGGKMKYSDASYDFPTNYGVGFGLSDPRSGLSLALDVNFPRAYYKDVRAGAEWKWKDMLAVRGGYRLERGPSDNPLTGPTFGLGGGHNGFWLDYGYLLGGNGSGEHRLALTFFPGQWSGLARSRVTARPARRRRRRPARRRRPRHRRLPRKASRTSISRRKRSRQGATRRELRGARPTAGPFGYSRPMVGASR